MKSIKILIIIFLGLILNSCETNDPLKDQSTLGKQNANIYFVPIDPFAEAGSEVGCEIEYWTVGNEIINQSLWDKIFITEDYEIKINNVAYTYKNSFDTLQRDHYIYKEYDFDFTDWTPDKNAYVFMTYYLVSQDYKKKTYKKNNTTKAEFAALISDKAKDNIFISILNNKSVLKSVLVDNNNLPIDTFNSWFDTNGITEEGKQFAKIALANLNLENLIGDNYKKIESYKIYLNFKITNGFGEENESSVRSFKVK